MIYLGAFIILLFLVFLIKLLIIQNNINKIENTIKKEFNSRTNMIPAVFEVTKNSFSKHDEIFSEILKNRKKELYKYYIEETTDNKENDFVKLIHIEELIYHEFNFIFKVSNKHPKLAKKWNFIYLRDLILSKSNNISKTLKEYKNKVNNYNKLIELKKFTIIWILVPISKKTVI